MDQIVATRFYLKDAIGLRSNQAGTNRANAIVSEGLDDPANLAELEEYGGLKTFYVMPTSQQVLNRSQAGLRLTQILII